MTYTRYRRKNIKATDNLFLQFMRRTEYPCQLQTEFGAIYCCFKHSDHLVNLKIYFTDISGFLVFGCVSMDTFLTWNP